jgi:hypothetical protein
MSANARLQFALKHLSSSGWSAFEQLASAYAAVDFPNLRTIAGVGEAGRDAVLYDSTSKSVVLQYSIVEDWKAKIRKTVRRLEEAGHACTTLIYFTNRKIGVAGDELKSELLKQGISLDVRDRTYFLDRIHSSRGQTYAAEEFAAAVVDPLLPLDDIVKNSPIANKQLRAGLLYLELQASDRGRGRNIARMSFDALVLAALQDTEPERRMARDEILEAVKRALPGRETKELEAGVDGALLRLRRKKQVNFTGSDKSYNLQFEQRRLRSDAALELLAEQEVPARN